MKYLVTISELEPGRSPVTHPECTVPSDDVEREIYRRELEHLDVHAVIIAVDGLDRIPEPERA